MNSKNFIDGLRISKAAGFLPVMELELKKWKGKAEKSKSDSEELYHTFMKAKTLCQGFYVILPQVWTDFLTIKTQGTDWNYVASGLLKHKKSRFGTAKCALPKSSLNNRLSSQNQP